MNEIAISAIRHSILIFKVLTTLTIWDKASWYSMNSSELTTQSPNRLVYILTKKPVLLKRKKRKSTLVKFIKFTLKANSSISRAASEKIKALS